MMQDQAQGLRELVAKVRQERDTGVAAGGFETVQPSVGGVPVELPSVPLALVEPRTVSTVPGTRRDTRVICVASGKGGVGKSSLVLNLATLLSSRGKRVLVVDADMGLANISIMAGIAPRYNMAHHFFDNVPLSAILVQGPGGVTILPGASGISEVADLTVTHRENLVRGLDSLAGDYDFILVDTGAGIGPNVITFAMAADEVLVVTMPEDIAVADAYGLIKTLFTRNFSGTVGLLVNRAASREQADAVIEKVKMVTTNFLGRALDRSGFILEDRGLRKFALSRSVMAAQKSFTPYVRCVRCLALELIDSLDGDRGDKGKKGFFRRLFGMLGC